MADGARQHSLRSTYSGDACILTSCVFAWLLQEWSTLQVLDDLDVSDNGLVGTYPASWSALTGLEQLFVNDNKLTGPMPVKPAGTMLGNLQVQNNQ